LKQLADGSRDTGHSAQNRRPCDILLFVTFLAASFGYVFSGETGAGNAG
jgi:hypothetical protein